MHRALNKFTLSAILLFVEKRKLSPVVFDSEDIEMSQSILPSKIIRTNRAPSPVYDPEDTPSSQERKEASIKGSRSSAPPSPTATHNSEDSVTGSPTKQDSENNLSTTQLKEQVPESACQDCVQCGIIDNRNYHFCKLLNTELQFLHPCMRTVAYRHILKIVDGLKGSHSKEDIQVVHVKPIKK